MGAGTLSGHHWRGRWRGRGDEVVLDRSVRAGRCASDLWWGNAADSLRPRPDATTRRWRGGRGRCGGSSRRNRADLLHAASAGSRTASMAGNRTPCGCSGLGVPCERLSVELAAQHFPSFNGDDLTWVLYEPEAGVLRARSAVQTLAEQALARGGGGARAGGGRRRGGRARRRQDAGGRSRSCWNAVAGSRGSSPAWSSCGSRGRSSSSSSAGRTGTRPAGWTTTARPTAPAASTRSA